MTEWQNNRMTRNSEDFHKNISQKPYIRTLKLKHPVSVTHISANNKQQQLTFSSNLLGIEYDLCSKR